MSFQLMGLSLNPLRCYKLNNSLQWATLILSTPVVPKVWGAPPWGGARGVWRKKIERNLHLTIFSELYLPYIYHPEVITNLITP
jgi:hypothetical protein